MPRYIDAERFKLWLQENYVLYDGDRYFNDIDAQPTADVVPREEMINELVNEISDRITQFLEANYEIIPKKPVVRCKECGIRLKDGYCPNGRFTPQVLLVWRKENGLWRLKSLLEL